MGRSRRTRVADAPAPEGIALVVTLRLALSVLEGVQVQGESDDVTIGTANDGDCGLTRVRVAFHSFGV